MRAERRAFFFPSASPEFAKLATVPELYVSNELPYAACFGALDPSRI